MRTFGACLVVLIVALAFGLTVTTVRAAEAADPKAVFEKKCSKCHGVDRPLGKTKKPDEWKATVERMMAKPNSDITKEDAEVIIKYLSTTQAPK